MTFEGLSIKGQVYGLECAYRGFVKDKDEEYQWLVQQDAKRLIDKIAKSNIPLMTDTSEKDCDEYIKNIEYIKKLNAVLGVSAQ